MAKSSTSASTLYARELKNIREQQQQTEKLRQAEKSKTQTRTSLGMQASAYIGKQAKEKTIADLKKTVELYDPVTKEVSKVSKFTQLPDEPTTFWFGKGEKAGLPDKTPLFGLDYGLEDPTFAEDSTLGQAYDRFTDFLGFSDDKIALSQEYIKKGLESGAGVTELGITKESLSSGILFPGGTSTGPVTISGKGGIELASATLGASGGVEITTKGFEEGAKKAAETSASSAGAVASKIGGGVSVVTGGAQMMQSEGLGDKDFYAGGAKAVGGALMFTPAAPIGMALTGIGTLLDFV